MGHDGPEEAGKQLAFLSNRPYEDEVGKVGWVTSWRYCGDCPIAPPQLARGYTGVKRPFHWIDKWDIFGIFDIFDILCKLPFLSFTTHTCLMP